MKFNIKKNEIIILFLMIIFSVLAYYTTSKIFKFIFIFILFLCIFKKAKFSFFSILTFIIIFTLFQELYLDVFNIGTGMLITGKEALNHFNELYLCTNIFCVVEYFFIINTNIIENENKIYILEIKMSKFLAIMFSFLALIITILIFPSIPTFKANLLNRFNSGIIPFSGFAGLTFLLIGITYDSGKRYKIIYFIDAFIIFWFFGHAERVEALGLLLYIFLKYINQNTIGLKNITNILKKNYKLILFSFAVIIFLTWLGMTRTNEHNNVVELNEIINKMFIQSTASDVAYIFNCSVELANNGNMMGGSTYLSYLSRIIPFLGDFQSAEEAIKQYYYTVGGCPYFAEAIMNFGMSGVFPIVTIFFIVHSWILRKINCYRAIFWIPIVIEIFRTAWYGWTGWFRLSIFITPIIYILIRKFNMVKKIK